MGDLAVGLTERIIGAAMRVHSVLGPGLLESVYEACLVAELREEGLAVEQQVAVPLRYRGVTLDASFRVDLLIERTVLVELKSVRAFEGIHFAQTRTYLKLSGCEVALLFNFNSVRLREGIRRFRPWKTAQEEPPLLPSSP